jgi:hypothetical protein
MKSINEGGKHIRSVGDSPHLIIIVLMRVNHFIYTMFNIYTHCSTETLQVRPVYSFYRFLTEEKSRQNMFEIPTGTSVPEYSEGNLVHSNYQVTVSLPADDLPHFLQRMGFTEDTDASVMCDVLANLYGDFCHAQAQAVVTSPTRSPNPGSR